MIFRHLKRGTPLPGDLQQILSLQVMVERGHSLSDLERIGYDIPSVPNLPLLWTAVLSGRVRYEKDQAKSIRSEVS